MSVYQRNVLSNGLRVLTAPLEHAQSVTCYIMLAAGSRYEDAGNRGIAHFAEHMFFKGTERRPTAKDIALEVDRIRRRVQRLHLEGVHRATTSAAPASSATRRSTCSST